MKNDWNSFPDYGPSNGNHGFNVPLPPLFPSDGKFSGRTVPGNESSSEKNGGMRRMDMGPPSEGAGWNVSPLSSVPLLSEEQLEAVRQRQEKRWNAIENEIAWCWDWKKIAAGWERLIDLDRRFFPQRFREYVAETLSQARYIPHYALQVVLNYCLHQPPAVQKLYYDLWREKLKTEKWSNWQQQMVVEEYLNEYHLRQKHERLPYMETNERLGEKPGAREWWEKMRLTREDGAMGKFSCPVGSAGDDVGIEELPEE